MGLGRLGEQVLNTPVSGVLTFYFRDEVLPYYAGDTTAARDLAANDFKYWDLMRRACERGLRIERQRLSRHLIIGLGVCDLEKVGAARAVPFTLIIEPRAVEIEPTAQRRHLALKCRCAKIGPLPAHIGFGDDPDEGLLRRGLPFWRV